MENIRINIRKGSWRSCNCSGLYRLANLVCIKSQILLDQTLWTTKLLTTRPRFILKRIKEEQMKLILAVNYNVNRRVVMKSVDLIFQVFLLARSIGLNINNIIRLINYWNIVAITQHYDKWSSLLRTNKLKFNMNYQFSINNIRSNKLDNIILNGLNNLISDLFNVIFKLGLDGYRYHNKLITLFYNILQNVIALICNRGIKCSVMFNEVINKRR
ncbi:Phosphoribosyl-AMP cyclohydrolase [Candidatus Hodgkinia cicadicola]|nr:Phosphoribosyl-AMP cyclohydrolase [Candidatus Hodgkinia cicadicola]